MTGTNALTLVPPPGADLILRWPPSRSARAAIAAIPTPVVGFICRFSRGIPLPSSITQAIAAPLLIATCTTRRAAPECLYALAMAS